MDFTELFKHTNSIVSFSPGGSWILNASQNRLIVRRTETFQITQSWLVDEPPSSSSRILTQRQAEKAAVRSNPNTSVVSSFDCITHAGWSSDSEYLFAACAKKGVVSVYNIRNEGWTARIESGVEGLVKAEWAPDGRHILCFSEWGLRVTIWSLVTGVAVHIQFPTHPDRGYAFRRDGRYFVLAERHKSKDTLGVYDAEISYALARHFPLPTKTFASLAISPTGNHVAVWEGPLEYKLCIMTLAGVHLASFTPTPDPGLGIRCVSWHPSGSFIAIGGYDEKIYILESLSWSTICVLEVSSRISPNVIVWREPAEWIEATHGRGFLSYERAQGAQSVSLVRPELSKPYPKTGTLQLEWNVSGNLLLARFENIPTALFLYSFPAPSEEFRPKLRSVLIQTHPILRAKWNPTRYGNLALCCGSAGVYIWSDEWTSEADPSMPAEEMAECIGVPAIGSFRLKDFQWAPQGEGLLLMDKDTFCGAFEAKRDEDVHDH